MKAKFVFDGQVLRLHLSVEDPVEKAMVRLMEAYNIVSVAVKYDDYRHGYDDGVKGLDVLLRKPAE